MSELLDDPVDGSGCGKVPGGSHSPTTRVVVGSSVNQVAVEDE
jgi:hypothetical protein